MTDEFEWDSQKEDRNIKKHGIRFDAAIQIFKGITLTFKDERKDYGELREISIGVIADNIIAVVVHTDRNGVTRIISARSANRKERKAYYEHCTKKP